MNKTLQCRIRVMVKNAKNSIIKRKILQKQSQQNTNVILFQNDNLTDICCLCGLHKNNHMDGIRHKFVKIKEEYRCRNCNKFFYEHNHSKVSCFFPNKYIV